MSTQEQKSFKFDRPNFYVPAMQRVLLSSPKLHE
jgi:hypothetical protein